MEPIVKINIDYNRITQIFSTAESDGRKSLFEYETYHRRFRPCRATWGKTNPFSPPTVLPYSCPNLPGTAPNPSSALSMPAACMNPWPRSWKKAACRFSAPAMRRLRHWPNTRATGCGWQNSKKKQDSNVSRQAAKLAKKAIKKNQSLREKSHKLLFVILLSRFWFPRRRMGTRKQLNYRRVGCAHQ